MSRVWQNPAILWLAAAFLFGMGVIAIEPPFEGFDETAHFSRLQSEAFAPQLAASASSEEKAAVVAKENDFSTHISTAVYDYYRRGPMPYMWISYDALHTYDPIKGGFLTYYEFAHRPDLVAAYIKDYRKQNFAASYDAGPEYNWQYQHPPLYYLALKPVMKLLAGQLPMNTLFFVLRGLSWCFAFAGMVIGILATRKYLVASGKEHAEGIILGMTLFPFMVPMFFWEFARLGNDSLCLLIFGVMWLEVLSHVHRPRDETSIYLGVLLGLGALTKALMLPVAAGVIAFLFLYHCFVLRRQDEHRKNWWHVPLKAIGYVLLVAAPGYAMNFSGSGQFGAGEFRRALEWQNAIDVLHKNFSWKEMIMALGNTYATMIGILSSWSKIVFSMFTFIPPMLMAALAGLGYIIILWRRRHEAALYLPLFCALPILGGLLAHILTMLIIMPENTYTPGYYLHVTAPALAFAYGIGLCWLMARRWLRGVFVLVTAFIVLDNFYIILGQMSVFSGCALPVHKETDFFVRFPAVKACAAQMPLVIDNLSVLAWPYMALGFFTLAFLFLLAGTVLLSRQAIYRVRVPS